MSTTVQEHNCTGIPNGKLGMWVFLASEVMLFGAFISSFIVLRIGSANFGTPPDEIMGRPLATLNTFVLISSSAAMVMALASIQENDIKNFARWMWGVIGLGSAFLVIKCFEYVHKIHEGLTLASSLFGSFYFTMTGLHALHMIAGLVFNGYILHQGLKGRWNNGRWERVEYAGLYWHFVDLVWVIIFPLFYLV